MIPSKAVMSLAVVPHSRTIWVSIPLSEIVSNEKGALHRYSEVRCMTDGERPGLVTVVRLSDGSIAFRHEPEVIVGYIRDGVRHGAARLWEGTTW